jgi:threonine/homoserine/homoserine lactone efflux protein
VTTILWFLCFGISFGLAATVPPGPINTEIARRTLKYGLIYGVAFGLGSIAVENGLAILACTGYGIELDQHPRWMPVLLFVGFMVLSIMGTTSFVNGYRAWQEPALLHDRGPTPPENDEPTPHPHQHLPATDPLAPAALTPGAIEAAAELAEEAKLAAAAAGGTLGRGTTVARSVAAGFGMAIISPYTIVFWIVGLPSAAHDALQQPQYVWALLLGIAIGTSLWIAGFSAMLAALKRYTSSSTWWIIWTDLIGGVMLLGFAALALLKLAQTLMQHRGPPMLIF